MGLGEYAYIAYIAVVLIVGLASFWYASSIRPPTMTQKMADPRSDLMVTTTSEGIVVPLVYGTCRLAGNIMFYGGLVSAIHYETVTQTGGGKGGGGGGGTSQQAQGYDYWLNVWEGICLGPVEILATYVADDKNKTVTAATTIWNDGTGITFPAWVGTDYCTGTMPTPTGGPDYWTYALGSFIWPGSFSVVGICQDDGQGHVLSSSGALQAGCSIDYNTGNVILTENLSTFALTGIMAGVLVGTPGKAIPTYRYCKGSDPNAPWAASPLPGIAHIGWEQWYMGQEAANIPSVTFVVKRTLPTTIDYANLANGANPAAVIWDILTNVKYGLGMDPSELNLATFNAAALIWYGKGFGMNLVMTRQSEAQSIIEQILGWVGGSFYIDNNGKFCIYAYNDADVSVCTLDETDFLEFQLDRPGWDTTVNDMRINYFDASNDYVSKTLALFDNANFRMQGIIHQESIDLTCFTDITTVSKRAWELLKGMSYPAMRMKFKLNQTKSYPIFAGCVVTISHADYAISNVKLRLLSMDLGEGDEIVVSYAGEEMLEAIQDSTYGLIIPDSSYWTAPDYTPIPLPHSRIFELPWNPITKSAPYYVFLGARASQEVICYDMKSIVSGTSDFASMASYIAFSQEGVLDVTYSATTYGIDDETGIIYTPHRTDLNFSDLRRSDLFQSTRFILIDDEIMGFQFHLPYGTGSQYQIMGVTRGLFNTTIAPHTAGAVVWIFYPLDNIISIADVNPFWVKMLPSNKTSTVDAAAVTAIAVTPTQKATKPLAPYIIEATRDTSNNISIIWYPHVREYTGAGFIAENATIDVWPFEIDGNFEYKIEVGGTVIAISECSLSINRTGTVTFYVRHIINSIASDWLSLVIDSAYGTYVTEIGFVTIAGIAPPITPPITPPVTVDWSIGSNIAPSNMTGYTDPSPCYIQVLRSEYYATSPAWRMFDGTSTPWTKDLRFLSSQNIAKSDAFSLFWAPPTNPNKTIYGFSIKATVAHPERAPSEFILIGITGQFLADYMMEDYGYPGLTWTAGEEKFFMRTGFLTNPDMLFAGVSLTLTAGQLGDGFLEVEEIKIYEAIVDPMPTIPVTWWECGNDFLSHTMTDYSAPSPYAITTFRSETLASSPAWRVLDGTSTPWTKNLSSLLGGQTVVVVETLSIQWSASPNKRIYGFSIKATTAHPEYAPSKILMSANSGQGLMDINMGYPGLTWAAGEEKFFLRLGYASITDMDQLFSTVEFTFVTSYLNNPTAILEIEEIKIFEAIVN